VQSDVRTSAEAAEGEGCAAWTLTSDVEALAWNPHSPTQFAVSCESGEVFMYDTRNGTASKPILQFSAHEKATTAVSFNPAIPGYFLTASTDKKVNLWEINASISKLASEDLKVGAVFAASFTRDAPMVMAAGGAKGTVAVWDTSLCEAVREKFQQ
jgi:periodic tryptophan protein 1